MLLICINNRKLASYCSWPKCAWVCLGMPIREVSRRLRIRPSTVSKYAKMYREKGDIEPFPRKHIRTRSKLSFGDSMLLETIVQTKGSTSLKEMKSELSNFGDCGEVSTSTISRHVRNRLPSTKSYSRKRLGKCAAERFTHENLVYTHWVVFWLHVRQRSFCSKVFWWDRISAAG